MQLEVGKILEGKVTGITKFGAFVELEPNKVGLVHISEVASTYVNDIAEHLESGQTVSVKVLSIGDDGKISLSIKKAQPPAPRSEQPRQKTFNNQGGRPQKQPFQNRRPDSPNHKPVSYHSTTPKSGSDSFEDMLGKFMKSSDEKISALKRKDNGRRSGTKRSK